MHRVGVFLVLVGITVAASEAKAISLCVTEMWHSGYYRNRDCDFNVFCAYEAGVTEDECVELPEKSNCHFELLKT